MSERDAERSVSQTVRAQLALRDMILSGQLRPGERISELQAVEITSVSRLPSVRCVPWVALPSASRGSTSKISDHEPMSLQP